MGMKYVPIQQTLSCSECKISDIGCVPPFWTVLVMWYYHCACMSYIFKSMFVYLEWVKTSHIKYTKSNYTVWHDLKHEMNRQTHHNIPCQGSMTSIVIIHMSVDCNLVLCQIFRIDLSMLSAKQCFSPNDHNVVCTCYVNM